MINIRDISVIYNVTGICPSFKLAKIHKKITSFRKLLTHSIISCVQFDWAQQELQNLGWCSQLHQKAKRDIKFHERHTPHLLDPMNRYLAHFDQWIEGCIVKYDYTTQIALVVPSHHRASLLCIVYETFNHWVSTTTILTCCCKMHILVHLR